MNFLSTAATYTPLIGHVIKAYHPFQTELFSKDETLISVVYAALSLSLDVSRHATDVILATTTIVSIIAVKVFLSSYLPAYIILIGISIAARVIIEAAAEQRLEAAAAVQRLQAVDIQVAAEQRLEEAETQAAAAKQRLQAINIQVAAAVQRVEALDKQVAAAVQKLQEALQ